ncbi:PAS domain-containing sensor histidine kinase [Fodinibius sp. SL11]|uniref:PAS domain-containing sensor histidine kinase n=1 Tax=Fodinibius sp. SL11 TaxID=3425690 RepID=UPI003F885196
MADSNFSDVNITTTFLDSLLAHVAIVDGSGIVIDYNEAWQNFDDASTVIKRPDTGVNYFEILQKAIEMGDDYALKFLLGLKKVLNGDTKSFSLTYPLKTDTNSFWFNVTIRPCNDNHSHFLMMHEDITASMHAKYEKKEHEDRFQVKFKQSLDGIFITDAEGNILEANQMACDMLKWNQHELVERSLESVINSQDPNYRSALEQRKKSGTYALELDFIDKQGNIIPTETTSRTYRNPEGKLRAIITFRDISRRKEIERDLIKTEQFAKSALNSIPGIFFVIDRRGNFMRWNENMITTLGYSAEELSRLKASDFVIDDYKEQVPLMIQHCIEEGEISIETKLIGKNEHIKDYSIFAKRFVEDGTVYIAATGIDITDRKKIERENRRHQIMMEQLFDNAPVGITIVDNNNNIQKVNNSFENIFGYTQKESLGQDIDTLLAPKNMQDEANALSIATQKGESLQTETIRINKSGEEVPVLIGSVPVKLEDDIIAIYGMYVDVSTQHNYRERIKQTLQEKEALLAELHHRVKNNLALINSLVELQLFEANSKRLKEELQDIKNRIMAIATTHEVLYQNGSLTRIPFNNFLQEFVNTRFVQHQKDANNVVINSPTQELFLNINQSIPIGLLFNELFTLICNFSDEGERCSIDIRLREYGKKVHLIIEGIQIINCPEEVKNNKSLHNILIDTLVMQLGGTLIWPNPGSEYQKFEFIFTKENSSSPASEYLEVAE